ncbi:YusW family protein [Psychrobacillus sp. OK032]|uniref:YusW family protein n=1 Tax=Psychrobacillus sp. OK032 TaxID=1884358 RepID=UPI0008D578EC|nr:YusW family protein [Psychrobacillus sp. OK032]SER68139.1 YusW-like protein [Psychrobacillus sp. OK032]
MRAKKQITLATILLSSTMLIAACGNNDEPEENGPNGTAFEEEQDEAVDESLTSDNPESEFGFRFLNLHISTPDNEDAIIAEYYGNSSKTESVYKNMHAAADVEGDAAYTLLEQVFTDLQLTQDMSKEEVIRRVTMAFDAADYTNFNLEIEYEDGETKTYSDSKE